MNTRKYDSTTRKSIKRLQRSPAYVAIKAMHDAHVAELQADITKVRKDLSEERKHVAKLNDDLRDANNLIANLRGDATPESTS